MKIILILLPLLFSCSSLYTTLDLKGVESIKISYFENFYESEPIGATYINNKPDVTKILLYLIFLPDSGIIDKFYHDFRTPRISIEFYVDDRVENLSIINDRLTVKTYTYYKRNFWLEKSFVRLIKGF